MSAEAVFSAERLRVGFRGARPVLDGVSLTLAPGDSLALLGPSGTGKTLLLKTLAGLIVPQAGVVRYHGTALAELSGEARAQFRRAVGMTFQKSGLFDSLTCGENLAFVLREAGEKSERGIRERVAKALDEVGLGGQEKLFVHEMSGGMQKRLGIARALLNSPRVVLYDEPTAGLDPITAHAINDLIASVQRKYEMTIVVVTSEPRQAYQLCRRLAFLYRGKIVAEGETEAMRNSREPAVKQFLHGLAEGPLTGVLA